MTTSLASSSKKGGQRWIGFALVVGAAVVVALADKTVFVADSRHAAVVAGQNCGCGAEVGQRYWWLSVEARSMRSALQTACRHLVVAPRLEEWAHTAVDCRMRE